MEVFNIGAGVNANISSLTLENGYFNTNGGAIDNNGTLTLQNDVLSGNTAGNSAAPFTARRLLAHHHQQFHHRRRCQSRGRRFSNGSSITITGSSISSNKANSGGGIYSFYSTVLTIQSGSTIGSNTALTGNGGGIFVNGILTITGSSVQYNLANSDGAGICGVDNNPNGNRPITINDTTLQGNRPAF